MSQQNQTSATTRSEEKRWTCFARPAHRGGKRCGHDNKGKARTVYFAGRDIECCEECGCTRHASELRRAKEAA